MVQHSWKTILLILLGMTLWVERDPHSAAHAFESSDSRLRRHLVGRIQFQKRYTRVFETECEDRPCFQSQVYWNAVLESASEHFIIQKKLNPGSLEPPQSIELSGEVLSEGDWVEIEGFVQGYGPQLFYFDTVDRVVPLADLGWSCFRADPMGGALFVRVWKGIGEPWGNKKYEFQMRIHRIEGTRVVPMAWFEHLSLVNQLDQWKMIGVSSQPQGIEAEFSVDQSDTRWTGLAAHLRLSTQAQESWAQGIQGDLFHSRFSKTYEMSCSRTRTLEVDGR